MTGMRRLARVLVAVSGTSAALLAGASLAATLTVNSVSDAVNPADGLCTLREALVAANANAPSGNVAGECAAGQAAPTIDVVAFALPGAGVRTIAPGAAFAALTEPVTINGYTQAGSSANTLAAGSNAVLLVEIDATGAGNAAPLLRFAAGSTGSQLRGLILNRFAGPAIGIANVANVRVAGNFIGTNAAGTALATNGASIAVLAQGATGTIVGGTAQADRNVISGGSAAQVFVQGGSNAMVQGNLIGTNALGTAALESAPTAIGVWLDTPGAQVGGALAGAGNVISGNAKGLVIQGSATLLVQGNRIGTDSVGTMPVPNEFHGIEIAAPGPGLIGGSGVGEGNVVAFNGSMGVYLNAIASGWRVVGNATLANGDRGIALWGGVLPLANDALDADSGANERQNFPLIDTVTLTPTSVRLQGRVEGAPLRTLVLDVYGSRPPVRPTSFLQGEVYLGAAPATITTDAQGRASFDVTLQVTTTPNLWVTATLTDRTGCVVAACGSTSEFAQRGVFAVTPRWSAASSQLPVSLTGHLFQPGATFAFGTPNAQGIAFVDAQHLNGLLPLLAPGTLYDVKVNNPDASTATMPKAFVTDFLDVAPSSEWYGPVMNIAANGITLGCTAGYYCGDNDVTRAQMALFLLRGLRGPFYVPPPATGTFADVPVGVFPADWIEQFYREGITSGCATNPLRYCPSDAVTRAQMAVFLLRSKHGSSYVPPPCTGMFTDVSCIAPRHQFVDWIEQLAREGITLGCATNPLRYCPDRAVVRLQMAAFLARTFGLDEARNVAPAVSAGANQAITLPAVASLSGAVTDDGLPNPPAITTLAWTQQSGPGTVTFGNPTVAWTTAGFSAAGTYVLRLTASDGALAAFDETTITVTGVLPPNSAPVVNAGVSQSITLPGTAALSGSVSDDGLPNPPASITLNWSKDSGPGMVAFGSPNAVTTTATFSVAGIYVLRLSASDGSLAASSALTITVDAAPPAGTLPPDPSTVAPPLDPTLATDFGSANAFLYTGANPIQTGVAPGTIDPSRAAVIRGRLLDKSSNPLPGVTVTIRNHPQYGQTLTRADGRFDIAVNGGGPLTLHYAKSGFLPAQRQVNAPWRDYAHAGDTILIGQDARVTTVDLTNTAPTFHVAQGSVVTDQDGTRQTTLLIPQGTQARVYNPNGTTRPVTSLNLRFTEYTIGTNGPTTMPAQLPPSSAYTYAFEATAAEADVKIAGKDVLFDRPVPFYVDNFLNFPVGIVVPVGYYDRDRSEWIPSDNGKVIRILAITAGVADIDSDGDGLADDAPTLAALGITTAERQQLANIYAAGKTLWRVPVTHLSQYDFNWAFVPANAVAPLNASPVVANADDSPVCQSGSIIECENQVLRESLPLVGSRFGLSYASDWAMERRTGRTARIALIGAQVPADLERIDLIIDVAGRRTELSFPAQPNQHYVFTWDGADAYGRPMIGAVAARVRIGYVYKAVLYANSVAFAEAFALYSGVALTTNFTRMEAVLWKAHVLRLMGRSPKSTDLAGWSLDVHHANDPLAGLLHLGTGARRHVDYLAQSGVITTFAGGAPAIGPGNGDGGPAVDAVLAVPDGVAVGPDATLYIAEGSGHRIRRVLPNGIIGTIAGSATSSNACGTDGVPALDVRLCSPRDVALAPDGSVYFTEQLANKIRRIGSDGIITTVAGNGAQGFGGDGGPATAASLNRPRAVAVGPDGSLYIADESNNRIRRVGTNGHITTAAGNGLQGSSGDGGPAMQARLTLPQGVAVALDGSIFIADTYNHLIRRVGPDGIITTVAGRVGLSGPSGDGGFATDAGLWYPTGVEVGLDGSLFISEGGGQYPRVRHVGLDGIITTVAGSGVPGLGGDGGPATAALLANPGRLAVGPDGSLFIPDSSSQRVRQVKPALPVFVGGNLALPSDDGSQLYVFDSNGRRHVRTVHALTGATLLQFGYDPANRLASVSDADGNVTTIERDVAGIPTAIVSPYGQRTTLTVDANGYLATVTNPAGQVHRMTYTAGGLLTEFRDPKGNASQMIHDAEGRLTSDADAAGGVKSLARTESPDSYEVAVATALGRTTRHRSERLGTGDRVRVQTATDGTQTETLLGTDSSDFTTAPDGTVVDVDKGPDPRFSMLAPLDKSRTVTTGGLSSALTTTRTATLSTPGNPLSLTAMSETNALNGRNYVTNYLAATRTFTETTPASRQSTTVIDAQGRPISAQLAGLEPAAATYDARGRIETLVSGTGGGARTYTYAYNAAGFVESITDPLGRVETYAYDAAGRVTSQTLPGGRVVHYAYDANGNLTSLTPPGRPTHGFTHTPVDLMASYVPPNVGAGTNQTLYAYNADRQLTQVSRPDGQTVAFGYDAAGRVNATTIARGTIGYGYSPTTGQLTSIAAPESLGLAYTYNGALLNTVTWSGPVAGTVARTYDNDFRTTGLAVNGAAVPFTYDADNLLTGAGAMTLSRSAQNGLLTGTSLGNATDAWTYNGFGEPLQYTASYGGTSIFQQQFTRDALGRIVQKVEIIGGITDTYVYSYDLAGRLAQVTKNAVVVATYAYDLNGNRLSVTTPGGTTAGAYDNQDRMTAYGTATYAYTANGELLTKTDGAQVTTYAYDALGNLTSVALPGGPTIGYLIDGRNRRVGRKVNNVLTQAFLYQSDLRPVAELDGGNTVVSRFVYGTKVNVPEYMVKGGVTYRLFTDHLGSPRLVVDVATGTVAQRIDYDEFGRVLADTNPGFQPFGFGGGIYDRNTGLVRFGARDYDAASGRWASKDPVGVAGPDTNLFAFVASDPLNYVDHDGNEPTAASQATTGGITAVSSIDPTSLTLPPIVHHFQAAYSIDPTSLLPSSGPSCGGANAPADPNIPTLSQGTFNPRTYGKPFVYMTPLEKIVAARNPHKAKLLKAYNSTVTTAGRWLNPVTPTPQTSYIGPAR